jgi:hypothetical protein
MNTTKVTNVHKIKKTDNIIKPHHNLTNFHTIQWLRKRINNPTIQKSIQTLFIEDDKDLPPDTDEGLSQLEIKNKKLRKFLDTYCKGIDKFEKVNIKPQYLYSELIMNKIMKLKKIFLEFDEDLSSIFYIIKESLRLTKWLKCSKRIKFR